MPFAVGQVVEGFVNVDPADRAFFELRRDAVRTHVRRLMPTTS